MTREVTAMQLYDATDTPWIATVVDHVVASIGEPWRALREKLEHGPVHATRVAAVLGALRRLIGGRAERAKIARQVRDLVLGHPALDPTEHARRLLAAADQLGVAAEEIPNLLWMDLADERPVTLPSGRPAELRLAAFANVDKIQRAVRRARELRLRVPGDAHELIRTARRYGLLATVTVDGEATVLDVIGPLALFHDTTVYGRALAALVPLLADHPGFELEVQCDFGHGTTTLRVAPPVLLPPVPISRGKPSLAARLARDLAKAAPAAHVELDPPPIASGVDLLYPDVRIDHAGTRWWIEILGFATADYLTCRLAAYAAAGITNVLLCADDKRLEVGADTRRLLGFRGQVKAAAVLAVLERAP
jgi:predicted nuclease of restriction endonuclease-like RecB superfamily